MQRYCNTCADSNNQPAKRGYPCCITAVQCICCRLTLGCPGGDLRDSHLTKDGLERCGFIAVIDCHSGDCSGHARGRCSARVLVMWPECGFCGDIRWWEQRQ